MTVPVRLTPGTLRERLPQCSNADEIKIDLTSGDWEEREANLVLKFLEKHEKYKQVFVFADRGVIMEDGNYSLVKAICKACEKAGTEEQATVTLTVMAVSPTLCKSWLQKMFELFHEIPCLRLRLFRYQLSALFYRLAEKESKPNRLQLDEASAFKVSLPSATRVHPPLLVKLRLGNGNNFQLEEFKLVAEAVELFLLPWYTPYLTIGCRVSRPGGFPALVQVLKSCDWLQHVRVSDFWLDSASCDALNVALGEFICDDRCALKSLSLDPWVQEDDDSPKRFTATCLTSLVLNNSLEYFDLKVRRRESTCYPTLEPFLPKLPKNLLQLSVTFSPHDVSSNVKANLIEGMKANQHLESLCLHPLEKGDHDFSDAIQQLCARNIVHKTAPKFSNGSLPLAALPHFLQQIQKRKLDRVPEGASAIQDCLQLLGPDTFLRQSTPLKPKNGKRKQKHPPEGQSKQPRVEGGQTLGSQGSKN